MSLVAVFATHKDAANKFHYQSSLFCDSPLYTLVVLVNSGALLYVLVSMCVLRHKNEHAMVKYPVC